MTPERIQAAVAELERQLAETIAMADEAMMRMRQKLAGLDDNTFDQTRLQLRLLARACEEVDEWSARIATWSALTLERVMMSRQESELTMRIVCLCWAEVLSPLELR